MDTKLDEFHGQGGSYEVRDGKRVRVREATKDHPEGNKPRDASGKPLAGPDSHLQPPAPAKPAAPVTSKGGAK